MIPCSHGGLIREKEEKVGCRKDNRQRALLECSSKNRWPLRNEAKIFSLLLAGAAEVCCLQRRNMSTRKLGNDQKSRSEQKSSSNLISTTSPSKKLVMKQPTEPQKSSKSISPRAKKANNIPQSPSSNSSYLLSDNDLPSVSDDIDTVVILDGSLSKNGR
jgi:hypothetical protein